MPIPAIETQVAMRKSTALDNRLRVLRDYRDGWRDFRNLTLVGSNFIGSDLRKADFTGADLTGAHFNSANLTGAVFNGAKLDRTEFQRAWLNKAEIRAASARLAHFTDTKLVEAALHGTDFSHASFQSADMRLAKLSGATLHYTDMQEADLTHAVFSHAKMEDADLRGAQLRGANFEHSTGIPWASASCGDDVMLGIDNGKEKRIFFGEYRMSYAQAKVFLSSMKEWAWAEQNLAWVISRREALRYIAERLGCK